MARDQQNAPYLDALSSYAFREPTRFHVPGHKGGPGADPALRRAIGDAALLFDIPKDLPGVDIGDPPTPMDRALALAAEAYGAQQTFFLVNGATQGNHSLALTVARTGARVIVQRNSHASVVDGLVLSGGAPQWVTPEYDADLGMANGITPETLKRALEAAPDARAVFMVSPTYYGMAADVEGCAEVAHAAGAALLVDQAWGAHFGFHRDLPPSALAVGADAVLTSTHKTVGSLTQSAMLHVGVGSRIDADRLARAVRLVSTTSPSSLLLGSLDASRRQLAIHGQDLLGRTLAASAWAREAIDEVPGCVVTGQDLVGRPGIAGYDPLRIPIDVRGTGVSGYAVAEALRDNSDVFVELATHAIVVILLGVGQTKEALERFVHDLRAEVEVIATAGESETVGQPPAMLDPEMILTPREAFLAETEQRPVDDAVGGISAEAIAGYPPGIPALLPGERVTADVVAYLRSLRDAGARLHGASDPDFETLHVVAD